MTTRVFLSVSAWGYSPERKAAVMAAIEEALSAEGLLDDFRDRRAPGQGWLTEVERLDGQPMLVAGSLLPVSLAGSPEVFEVRAGAALSSRVSVAGGACGRAFEMRYADDAATGLPDPLAARLHAVANVQGDEIEGLRGDETRRLRAELARAFFTLPAWDQRDAMLHLFTDLCELGDPALDPVFRAMLDSPASRFESTARHLAQVSSLCGLARSIMPVDDLLNSLELTNDVIARMKAGAPFDQAFAAGRQKHEVAKIARRGLVPPGTTYDGPTSPFAWDAAARTLTLSDATFPPLGGPLSRLVDAELPSGGEVLKALLACWLDEREPGGRRLLLALLDSLVVEVAAEADVPPLVEAARALLGDPGLLSRLLPAAIDRALAQRRAWAAVDPLFGKGYDDAAWFSLERADGAQLERLARHPEPGVVEMLLPLGSRLPPSLFAELAARREARRRALSGA